MRHKDKYSMNNPIIIFDGICNLCNSSINFIIKNDSKRIFRFTQLQSEAGKNLAEEYEISEKNFDSVVLIQNEKVFLKSSAALEISKQLQFPINLSIVFKIIPKLLRDKVYDFISRNRYVWFGKSKECMIPSNEIRNLFLE